VVSYALGSKMPDSDIKLIGEDDPQVVTFSKALTIPLTRYCRNNCSYCNFRKMDQLTVPYSTIKATKMARNANIREVYFVAGERPDKSPQIRAVLDLWGFNSYLDYLYTIAELSFLEGLIPVLDLGFLTPQEMEKLSEISAIFKIGLDALDLDKENEFYKASPGKRYEIRLKSLTWAGKLKIPVATGLLLGIGEGHAFKKMMLNDLAALHAEYGIIHEVQIQNILPSRNNPTIKPVDKAEMMKTIDMAFELLPKDIKIIVAAENTPDIADYIKMGIRDVGRINESQSIISMQQLNETVQSLGLTLQQRFPLRMEYIRDVRYSKKLGQVFDAYRYKIKKEEQEKQKDLKPISNENKK